MNKNNNMKITLLLLIILSAAADAFETLDTLPNTPSCMAASRDGKRLFVGDTEGYISQWHIEAKKAISSTKAHTGRIASIFMAWDDSFVVSGGFDNSIVLLHTDGDTEMKRFLGHEGTVTSVALTRDNKFIVSGSADRTVRVWDVEKVSVLKVFDDFQGVVTSIGLLNDSESIIAGTTEGVISLINIKEGSIRRINGHTGVVSSLIHIPDSPFFVSASWDRSIALWDMKRLCVVKRCRGHEYWVTSLSLFKDRVVSAGSLDYSIRVWDIRDCKEQMLLKDNEGYISSAVFSGDGRYIFSLTLNKGIKRWDAKTGE